MCEAYRTVRAKGAVGTGWTVSNGDAATHTAPAYYSKILCAADASVKVIDGSTGQARSNKVAA